MNQRSDILPPLDAEPPPPENILQTICVKFVVLVCVYGVPTTEPVVVSTTL